MLTVDMTELQRCQGLGRGAPARQVTDHVGRPLLWCYVTPSSTISPGRFRTGWSDWKTIRAVNMLILT